MALALCLQDWTTIAGDAGVVISMPADAYMDVAPYRGIAAYVEISAVGGGAALAIETAPTREASYFTVLQDAAAARFRYATSGVQGLLIAQFSDAVMPGARFVRWSLSAGAPWSMTFRIYLSLNQALSSQLTRAGIRKQRSTMRSS